MTGTVTVDGKPLTNGSVLFVPDPSKGNTDKIEASGLIDDQGVYRLTSEGQSGAKPGYYRVIVTASAPTASVDNRRPSPTTSSPIANKYKYLSQTDLVIEVKGGESVDLRLSGPAGE